LQCTIQDEVIWLGSGDETVQVDWETLKSPPQSP
jgi:hypothetical protein